MATIHPSAQLRNVERTVLRHLATAGLPVGAIVPVGDHRFDSTSVASFVRVSVRPAAETYSGRSAGGTYRTTRARSLVTCECYARGSGTRDVATVDAVEEVAEQVAHRLRLADLPLVDFVADPTGATPVTGTTVRFIRPPNVLHLDPEGSWDRRIVTAEGTHHIRHAE